ncbi:uncharacterized protein N7479_003339 [Penicillium vulpinum]|uniref:uncharacterized protein n=1 Tax=Penicillium vulpinum TaxID=29845 RepID=UPI0025482FE9|nr:uncharacterized protein N7479_003339 [Penicillium vulpinum]KAJ5963463.1 hypothetical protein N7479_003339 [Penicillium vulpinum]
MILYTYLHRNVSRNRNVQCVRIGRQMKANRGINHHPPLRPRASPPTERSKEKNPLVAPTSVSFSPGSIHLTSSKITIHANRLSPRNRFDIHRTCDKFAPSRIRHLESHLSACATRIST